MFEVSLPEKILGWTCVAILTIGGVLLGILGIKYWWIELKAPNCDSYTIAEFEAKQVPKYCVEGV